MGYNDYNTIKSFIREHEALNGQTPAEACGIPDRRTEQVENSDRERKQKTLNTSYKQKNASSVALKVFFSERHQ